LTSAGCSIQTPFWSPDGKRIAFALGTDCLSPHEIAVIQADGKGLRELTPRRSTRVYSSPAWSPDGKKLVFSSGPETGAIGDIYVMNPDGSHLQRLTTNGSDFDPSWQPLGSK
jgi:TolB protein